jgi:hypothetical protein
MLLRSLSPAVLPCGEEFRGTHQIFSSTSATTINLIYRSINHEKFETSRFLPYFLSLARGHREVSGHEVVTSDFIHVRATGAGAVSGVLSCESSSEWAPHQAAALDLSLCE